MMFFIRNPERRAIAREQFIADCERIKNGHISQRAIETDIYITNNCNLRCDYCYFYFEEYFNAPSHHVPNDLSLEQLKKLVDVMSGKTYCLVILGGEPF